MWVAQGKCMTNSWQECLLLLLSLRPTACVNNALLLTDVDLVRQRYSYMCFYVKVPHHIRAMLLATALLRFLPPFAVWIWAMFPQTWTSSAPTSSLHRADRCTKASEVRIGYISQNFRSIYGYRSRSSGLVPLPFSGNMVDHDDCVCVCELDSMNACVKDTGPVLSTNLHVDVSMHPGTPFLKIGLSHVQQWPKPVSCCRRQRRRKN